MRETLNENKAKKIVDSYINLINHLNKKNGALSEKLVLNKDWDKITDDLEVIYCGDNPGAEELDAGLYFIGEAGLNLMNFVELTNEKYKIKASTFFNKTPYSSTQTKDIKPKHDPEQIIKKSIVLTVNCIFKLWKNNPNIKLFVFGFSDSYIVRNFRRIIKIKLETCPEFKENIRVLPHPSYNHLNIKIAKCVLEHLSIKDSLNYDDLITAISDEDWL